MMAAMFGPAILVRTLSQPAPTGKGGRAWQYHSRSDRHSKAACWGVLFDLMLTSRLLEGHIAEGLVGFGINHEMRDFKQNRKKNLDLVLCVPAKERVRRESRTFADLADQYRIELDTSERKKLAELPVLHERDVGSVLVALEAKACMTAHGKAMARLYDELNSSHQTIHGANEFVIAAGFVMVNTAADFVSPGRVGYCPHCGEKVAPINHHKQPAAATQVIKKMEELPRRASTQGDGFDALAIVAVDLRNDGSPVKLITEKPAPPPGDIFHYNQAIARLAQLYESRFPHV
jgi:hypothetical protein